MDPGLVPRQTVAERAEPQPPESKLRTLKHNGCFTRISVVATKHHHQKQLGEESH